MCGWRPQQRLSSGTFELVAQPHTGGIWAGKTRILPRIRPRIRLTYVLPVSAGDTTIHTTIVSKLGTTYPYLGKIRLGKTYLTGAYLGTPSPGYYCR